MDRQSRFMSSAWFFLSHTSTLHTRVHEYGIHSRLCEVNDANALNIMYVATKGEAYSI